MSAIKVPNILRASLMLLFAVFLLNLVVTQSILMLVSPLIASIVKMSIIVFILVSFGALASSLPIRSSKRERANHSHHTHSTHPGSHHDQNHDGHQHLSTNSLWGRITMGLLVTSIALAFTWHPTVFGTNMLGQTNIARAGIASTQAAATSASSLSNQHSASAASVAADTANYYGAEGAAVQAPGQFSAAKLAVDYQSEPRQFLGRKVSLQGFVYHPSGLPSNEFIVARFFIVCCIMDMVPWGVAIVSRDGVGLKNNTWVSVTGDLVTKHIPQLQNYDPTSWVPNGSNQPIIQADTVVRIPVPKLPYLVPNY